MAYFLNEHVWGLNIQKVPDTAQPHKASLR
jgi:hypothetical protein